MNNRDSKHAYLATLAAIVGLSCAGAAAIIWAPSQTEVEVAKLIGALSFIGLGVSGLIGVIGTFRPQQNPQVGPNENVEIQP